MRTITIILCILIMLLLYKYLSIKEMYDYMKEYEPALLKGVVTGSVYADPDNAYGLGWVN